MFGYNFNYRNYNRYNYNNYSGNRYNNYNNYGYYNNYYNNNFKHYNNSAFTPMYNYFYEQSLDSSINSTENPNNFNTNENNDNENNCNNINNNNNDNKKNFRFGPIQIEDNNIKAFGFKLAIDDLIIIGLIILLFFQTDKDYTLIIILGLMLFNINFSNLDILSSF